MMLWSGSLSKKVEEAYVGFPTQLLSNLLTNYGRMNGDLQEDDTLEVQAIDVQGELSIALVNKVSERILN